MNHTVQSCNYKFNDKWFTCTKYHVNFLCSSNDNTDKEPVNKSNASSNDYKTSNKIHSLTCVKIFVVLQAQSPNSNVLLPKLTARTIKNAQPKTKKQTNIIYFDPHMLQNADHICYLNLGL